MPSVGVQTCALDRKSTRLNSSHTIISYAVFCLKKIRSDRKSTRLNSSHKIISYDVFCLKKKMFVKLVLIQISIQKILNFFLLMYLRVRYLFFLYIWRHYNSYQIPFSSFSM